MQTRDDERPIFRHGFFAIIPTGGGDKFTASKGQPNSQNILLDIVVKTALGLGLELHSPPRNKYNLLESTARFPACE